MGYTIVGESKRNCQKDAFCYIIQGPPDLGAESSKWPWSEMHPAAIIKTSIATHRPVLAKHFLVQQNL